MLRPAAAVVAVTALAVGFGRSDRVVTGTVACSTNSFEISFDPARRVVATSSGKVLASASLTSLSLGGTCRRVPDPKTFARAGLGPEIRSKLAFRCAASAPVRIHVSPIRNGAGKIVGSTLDVGTGARRLQVIVSAVLKGSGSRVSRARSACKLGAKF
jgi:hypothetical protein